MVKDNRKVKKNKPLSAQHLGEYCRRIGMLTGAGIPLVRALEMMAADENIRKTDRKVYADLLHRDRQGADLSKAMGKENGAFPMLLIYMFQAGEVGGNLDEVSAGMAAYYDKQHRLDTKVRNAVLYPKILLVMIIAVVIFMLAWILPGFSELFARMETLPLTTRILFSISDFLLLNWPVLLIAAVVLWISGMGLRRIYVVAMLADRMKAHLPVAGKIFRIIYTARFARTLSSLYTAGIPILQSLEISGKVMGNVWLESRFSEVMQRVKSGENLSDALEGMDGISGKPASAVRVGEETGSLDRMLISIADALDYEAEMATERLVSMLEPILVVIMGVIVGFIMLAVMQPIYGAYDTLGI